MGYHDYQVRFPVPIKATWCFNLLVNTLLNSDKNYTIPRNILYLIKLDSKPSLIEAKLKRTHYLQTQATHT